MSDRRFRVGGATLRDQAAWLAGVLAEFGAQALMATTSDSDDLALDARTCDLPGLVMSGRVTRLNCDQLGLAVWVGDQLAAACSRPDVRTRLATTA